MTNQIKIPLPNGTEIVAELCNYDGEHPELCICIQDGSGLATQDLVIVRPHENDEDERVGNDVDVLVWSDEYDEDYTHKFIVPPYNEE